MLLRPPKFMLKSPLPLPLPRPLPPPFQGLPPHGLPPHGLPPHGPPSHGLPPHAWAALSGRAHAASIAVTARIFFKFFITKSPVKGYPRERYAPKPGGAFSAFYQPARLARSRPLRRLIACIERR